MPLKSNKKGITGMIDAIIFIIVISLALSAMYLQDLETDPQHDDASMISDIVTSAKFHMKDVVDTDDSRIINLTDLLASASVTGDTDITDYVDALIDSIIGIPDMYSLHVDYGGDSLEIGNGKGTPTSSCTRDVQVTFGGHMSMTLDVYL